MLSGRWSECARPQARQATTGHISNLLVIYKRYPGFACLSYHIMFWERAFWKFARGGPLKLAQLIQRLGRWRSDCFKIYVKDSKRSICMAQKSLDLWCAFFSFALHSSNTNVFWRGGNYGDPVMDTCAKYTTIGLREGWSTYTCIDRSLIRQVFSLTLSPSNTKVMSWVRGLI